MGRVLPTERERGAEEAGKPAAIRNIEVLLEHGVIPSRKLALEVAGAGLAACDPVLAVERMVELRGDDLIVDGVAHPIHPDGRIVVLGAGKASLKIAWALERILGDRLDGGTVVVRHDDAAQALQRIELLEASHPLPDERSVTAARQLLEQAESLGERDLAIACFTGGSSALASLPPTGVSEADKRELHRVLLASGIPISEVNMVRKQVSAFKGGRLALAAGPARLINLTVSDVAGDALDAITDPSVANGSGPEDAIGVLRGHGLWKLVPESIRGHLGDPRLAPPDLTGVQIHSTFLVTGETACEAMALEARAAGAEPVVISTSLEDEAVSIGRILAGLAAETAVRGRPFPCPSVLIGCGGEATVTLGPGDEFGRGGPNTEAALAASSRLEGLPIAAVFLDTDGSDGGSDLAGAIADGSTTERAGASEVDLRRALAEHRSGDAALALGDAIETGPTHTNVNDLFVVAIGEPSHG